MNYLHFNRYDQEIDYTNMSQRLINALPAIRRVALNLPREHIGDLEYTPEQMKRDMEDYLELFLNAIPPFETVGDLRPRKPTELASILNVGWFIAAFRMDKFKIASTYEPKSAGPALICLDQLVVKAIELSEIRREWMAI